MLARIATSEKEVGLRAALTAVLSELACTFLQSTREVRARSIMYKLAIDSRPGAGHAHRAHWDRHLGTTKH